MTALILMFKFRDLTRPLKMKRDKFWYSGKLGGNGTRQQERRREARHSASNRLFIQVVESDYSHLTGYTISGEATDISVEGLQLSCQAQIPTASLVDIWVDDNNKPGNFFLSGRVVWSLADETQEGIYRAGIRLLDSQATDIRKWQLRLSQRENTQH